MRKIFEKALAVLGVTVIAGSSLVITSGIEEAEAAGPPNPYTTSTLTKTYDGTGFVNDKPAPLIKFYK